MDWSTSKRESLAADAARAGCLVTGTTKVLLSLCVETNFCGAACEASQKLLLVTWGS